MNKISFDIEEIKAQFVGLEIDQITSWPNWPKWTAIIFAVIALIGVWIWAVVQPKVDELHQAMQQELTLRNGLVDKFTKAASLPKLRENAEEAKKRLVMLDSRLPPKEEIPKVLSHVNRLGYSRELNFGLFEPQAVVNKQDFAFVPVKVQMRGDFANVFQFVTDIAMSNRMLSFEQFRLSFTQNQGVNMDGRLLAFRQSGGSMGDGSAKP